MEPEELDSLVRRVLLGKSEDLIQDVTVILWEHVLRQKKSHEGKISKALIHQVAKSREIDGVRRARLRPQTLGMDLDLLEAPEHDHLVRDSVAFLLNSLTKDQQEILRLRLMDGCTFMEIGGFLGVSSDAARQRVHRLIQKVSELASDAGIGLEDLL